MIQHLWQSTLFAAAAGLLTLAFRENRAGTRYWIWLAASVKFLVPFWLLVEAGSRFGWRTATEITGTSFSFVLDQASRPFAASAPYRMLPAAAQGPDWSWLPTLLWALWAAGFVTRAGSWWRRWRGVRAALRAASPLDLGIGIAVRSSPEFAEPGVFGIVRPVLLVPAGIAEHLTAAQLDAILAHELCHVRRRDNLTTAIHMAVEAVFWFHPLVWWMGARLMEERERACDEEVLLAGNEPQAYAEGILKICELYLESPLPCVSGVTGANLKKRIEAILSQRVGRRLTLVKRAALAAAGAGALLVPVGTGILHAPALRAQAPAAAGPVPKIEVASIRPCSEDDGGGRGSGKKGGRGGRVRWSPGRLTVECPTLDFMIRDAYLRYADGKPWPAAKHGEDPSSGNLASSGLPPISDRQAREPIKGSPAWVGSARYTIEVKAEGTASQEMMRGPMMQKLLEDRFKLKIRRESREVPVYELTVAKGGAKLQAFQEGSCVNGFAQEREPGQPFPRVCGMFNPGKQGGTDVPGTTIGSLCRQFSVTFDRDVVDKTGIAGMFDLHFDTHPLTRPGDAQNEPGPPSDAEKAWLAEAMLAQFRDALPKLGLKLEAGKGPGVFLVMDHVERPSGN